MAKYFLLGLLAAFAVGCGDESEDDADIKPTLASIQKNVFDQSCSAGSCHGESKQGGLDLRSGSAYESLVDADPQNAAAKADGLKRVVAGDPNKSFLLKKLADLPTKYGKPMPLGGAKLSSEKINAIKTWIDQGAKQ